MRQEHEVIVQNILSGTYERGAAGLGMLSGAHHLMVNALSEAGYEIVRKPQPGSTAEERVEFARRTGCWNGVTDRDYRTWLASLQQTIVPPGAGRPLTDREISDRLTPGYQKALLLVRGGHPKASEVAAALGGDSADGPEGNVWALFDMRLQAFLKGRFEVLHAGPVTMEPCRLTELSPGAKAVEVPGLVLRDNGILAVFYDDGHIAFGGDAADMVAFRDMAATVVGVPKAAA
ncbi:hypothetical protein NS228_05315 [Methylobacterium indicum]|uniref:hypothetical protein n=1 Tax=Methylobacterium indicum TaxID=1775910 RepID=UPI0007348C88|nr:hypothetical protein [Methylobacterium indicum]KTS34216.1 hypothetical protein NS229_11410 [Methylobacterium indicum]KTS41800.1 hypothetical protein NS228_05315 [Methylobacterium indicum]KTS53104.1 hypothetical protein NS230_07660 [Methylobacterium indicum]